jgi:hypothetical protein
VLPPNDEPAPNIGTVATASNNIVYTRASTLAPPAARRDPQLEDDADTAPAASLPRFITTPVMRTENVVVPPQRQRLLYYVLQADASSNADVAFKQQQLGPATVSMLQAAATAVKKEMSECAESILR